MYFFYICDWEHSQAGSPCTDGKVTTPFLLMQSNKIRFETSRRRTNELAINFNKIFTECSSCKRSDINEKIREREEREREKNGYNVDLVPCLELMIRFFFFCNTAIFTFFIKCLYAGFLLSFFWSATAIRFAINVRHKQAENQVLEGH